jgi:hypothetical protein
MLNTATKILSPMIETPNITMKIPNPLTEMANPLMEIPNLTMEMPNPLTETKNPLTEISNQTKKTAILFWLVSKNKITLT